MAEPITRFDGEHRFLSNFHVAPIEVHLGLLEAESIRATSAEHAFQALKTTDPDERAAVLACETPGRAKRMGRKVTMRADWDDLRLFVMEMVVRGKFLDPALADLLVATGDAQLVEGNTWGDRFWGVDLADGRGLNVLGLTLMKERARLVALRSS
ncbi:NADAR family protein [Streptomyces sp. NPDC001118]